jgi:hypothetical protein
LVLSLAGMGLGFQLIFMSFLSSIMGLPPRRDGGIGYSATRNRRTS